MLYLHNPDCKNNLFWSTRILFLPLLLVGNLFRINTGFTFKLIISLISTLLQYILLEFPVCTPYGLTIDISVAGGYLIRNIITAVKSFISYNYNPTKIVIFFYSI